MVTKEVITRSGCTAVVTFREVDGLVRAQVVGRPELEVHATSYQRAEQKIANRLDLAVDIDAA